MKRTRFFTTALITALALSIGSIAFANGLSARSSGSYKLPNTQTEKFSLNFQNIPVAALLQLIAKTSHLNFVVSNSVKGDMSIHLQNTSWRQAMHIILKSNGLGSRRIGNTMLIGPVEELTNNEIKEMQAKQKLAAMEPLNFRIISLKYANAKDLARLLKGQNNTLLSPRGQVGEDLRTNSLLVYDTRGHLSQVASFIRRLDIPAKQVLIQVQIVDVDDSYEKELGVRFGVSTPKHLSGTLAGGNQGAQGTPLADITPFTDRLNFDLPATTLFSNPASIGVALAKLGNVFIDAELSALEAEGALKIVSTPRLITSNQETATIQQGEEIPYLEATSSGASSISFKDALLSLEVTPQINPDNRIMLNIKVTENRAGKQVIVNTDTQVSTLSPPAINTQELQSSVLLNNGETVALGGIYRISKNNQVERVPFLGSLPLIGVFFGHTAIQKTKRELLVFITPTVLKKLPTDFPPGTDIPHVESK